MRQETNKVVHKEENSSTYPAFCRYKLIFRWKALGAHLEHRSEAERAMPGKQVGRAREKEEEEQGTFFMRHVFGISLLLIRIFREGAQSSERTNEISCMPPVLEEKERCFV